MNRYLLLPVFMLTICKTSLWAQQQAPPAGGGGNFLIMMVPILLIVYFFMIRPEQKKQKVRQMMLQNVKKGDKVLTVGGIIGVVSNVKESTMMLKIADNTTIEVTKSSVSSVMNGETGEKSIESSRENKK